VRWKAPQPVQRWNGIRSIAEWGPRCVQSSRLGDLDPLNERMDEDCLYLNVWTPATSSSQLLPVMVWIHGQQPEWCGSQPEFDGSHLASKGVVVVTINYRLDVFGFLAHPELTKESGTNSSGDYGLLDQIAALKWVQRNIRAFGGDPNQQGYDEPGIVSYAIRPFCPTSADGLQRRIANSVSCCPASCPD
jgi:para-nitrobenzyl esterase